ERRSLPPRPRAALDPRRPGARAQVRRLDRRPLDARPRGPAVRHRHGEARWSPARRRPQYARRRELRPRDPPDRPGQGRRVIYTGTSGWVYAHWRGRFYPKEIAARRWLAYMATRL